MSAHRWPDHDWRADQYGLIRGPYAAVVRRAWCSDESASDPWSWAIFRTDVGDCAPINPEEGRRFTREEAIAAAEAFIAEREREEQGLRWARFEGVPLPADCEAF